MLHWWRTGTLPGEILGPQERGPRKLFRRDKGRTQPETTRRKIRDQTEILLDGLVVYTPVCTALKLFSSSNQNFEMKTTHSPNKGCDQNAVIHSSRVEARRICGRVENWGCCETLHDQHGWSWSAGKTLNSNSASSKFGK